MRPAGLIPSTFWYMPCLAGPQPCPLATRSLHSFDSTLTHLRSRVDSNMAAARYDVVIIGAGHNGLTCGAYLARKGIRTIVLERRDVIGGAAVTEEFAPGFRTSTFSYVM